MSQLKQIVIFLLLLFIISGCSTTTENPVIEKEIIQEEEPMLDSIVIVAFGDSLTEGYGIDREEAYPAQLENSLIELGYDVKVFNSGYSGETSTGALNRVNWVLTLNPEIVILTTGANDAIRGIDLSITKSNIEKIIDNLEKNNVTVILSGMEIYDNLGETYTKEFREIYPQIAQEKNISFIPLFLEGVAANSSLNIADQIHPNKEGYEIIVNQNILPKLVPLLE